MYLVECSGRLSLVLDAIIVVILDRSRTFYYNNNSSCFCVLYTLVLH